MHMSRADNVGGWGLLLVCPLTKTMRMQYRNDPKISDSYAWANSADPDQTADQGLHCLPFRLHRLDSSHIVQILE